MSFSRFTGFAFCFALVPHVLLADADRTPLPKGFKAAITQKFNPPEDAYGALINVGIAICSDGAFETFMAESHAAKRITPENRKVTVEKLYDSMLRAAKRALIESPELQAGFEKDRWYYLEVVLVSEAEEEDLVRIPTAMIPELPCQNGPIS